MGQQNPIRIVLRPQRGADGLFIQPDDVSAEREIVEHRLRWAAADNFNYADPYCGVPRTFDHEGRYNCGRCNQAEGSQCILVKLPSIDREAGSCRKWTRLSAASSETLLGYGSAEEAAYGVAKNGVGFGCKRCPYSSKAVQPDSMGRSLYCGKFWIRVFENACCSLNGAPVEPLAAKKMTHAELREILTAG